MPRDPLAWLPLLRHWTHCLGEGPLAIPRMGDLGALPDLDMAALLPGGPGWSDVQRSLRHDPEGAFRLLYYGLALRGAGGAAGAGAIGERRKHGGAAGDGADPCAQPLGDDASSDATQQLGRQLPWLRIWRSEHNQGFLDTCNGAAELARGELLLLLNNDTLVGDHALDRLAESFQRHPDAGVVGSAFWGVDGMPQEVGGIVWASVQVWNQGRGFPPEKWFALGYERQCDSVSGCGLAIRTELWQQLGGFDRRYCPAYCEDTDLCLRVREAGQSVWVQPAARILHLEGLSHSRRTDQGLKQHQVRNLEQLKQRWQHSLDTEQPPEGMPWLLAADRGLLGRPLALLLQPDGEAMAQCDQRGWVPLVLRDDWTLEWLIDHFTGPLLPEIALVGEPPAGASIPDGWLQQTNATQLPQRPVGVACGLPALPGWDREMVRVLACSSGLHGHSWLETPSRLVIQLLGEGEGAGGLRLGLYLPVVQRSKPSARSTVVIQISSAPLVQPANPSDQRRLMAVLAELDPVCSGAFV